MPNRHFRLLQASALFLITIIFVAACGPAPEQDGAPTSETPPAGVDMPSATNEAPESEPSDAPAAGQVAAASDRPTIDVEPGSEETDENGVTVGFTTDGYAFRGDPTAPVVLEEFSDYQCPFCSRFFHQTLPSLEENQIASGEVVLVYYDFPLTQIHPQAPAAHEAAHCAGQEGAVAYWAMHDLLFENIDEWSGSNNAASIFSGYASELDLDETQFNSCLEDGAFQARVQAGLERGAARGVNSTPSFFLNGQRLVGAQPLQVFNEAIATVLEGRELVQEPEEPAQEPAAAPTPAAISNDIAAAKGDPSAPVTFVEFTDYQCPYCARYVEQTLPNLLETFVESGDVYYVMKDFPLDHIHEEARAAAAAARCAGEQDAYWEMHDLLFARQPLWAEKGDEESAAVFGEMAAELALDEDAFEACLDSGRFDGAIESNVSEGRALGVSGTPAFFIDGYPVVGAQPFELFAYAIELAQEDRLAEAYTQQPEPEPEQPQEPADVPLGDAPAIGDPDAPVVIVEYTDFQCPYCARHFQQTFPRIVENFVDTGMVYYVFKDYPLTDIHPQAVDAAEAARCAREQDAFILMHDMLFERQDVWNGRNNASEIFVEFAQELGLEQEPFSQCLESDRHVEGIMADLEEGASLGVRGTPGFFINGYLVSGAQPYELFEQAVSQLAQESE
ncbi:MAG TPA: thioredoxin domain-containing protein [Candidatus Sulfomarinibacteraceae bacterium]|nr:thioredoxin domain-containing protein [Candidatus Sulfomarinibacteraceae bacterium]